MTPPHRYRRAGGRPHRRRASKLKQDAHVCWLCGQPIDPELKAPHPYSFSADHVVPLARGGHMLGELRPAHRICNMRRGTGSPQPSRRSRQW